MSAKPSPAARRAKSAGLNFLLFYRFRGCSMAEIDGQTILARALKQQGVEKMFGVVGIPVTGVARAAQSEGIEYIGMRHEMPATYAAPAGSYLGGRSGGA